MVNSDELLRLLNHLVLQSEMLVLKGFVCISGNTCQVSGLSWCGIQGCNSLSVLCSKHLPTELSHGPKLCLITYQGRS